ncbi:DUF998 domain-containing protein [Candidatus Bathyarchaeota archaeon]|nr:DUF998 domain-containing protein [Candidatus Bathyarchaeota archaeon]
MLRAAKSVDKKAIFLALCGFIGPVIYFIVLIVLGMLWKGYDPINQGMSELGAADSPYAFFMNLFGFQLLGIFIIAFGIGLNRYLNNKWGSKIGIALIFIGGIDLIIIGFFPTDVGGITSTFTGLVHDITATIASNVIILGIMFLGLHFRGETAWKNYWIFTLVLAIASLSLSPFPLFSENNEYLGLFQRLGIGFALFWMAVISIKLIYLIRKFKEAG